MRLLDTLNLDPDTRDSVVISLNFAVSAFGMPTSEARGAPYSGGFHVLLKHERYTFLARRTHAQWDAIEAKRRPTEAANTPTGRPVLYMLAQALAEVASDGTFQGGPKPAAIAVGGQILDLTPFHNHTTAESYTVVWDNGHSATYPLGSG